MLGFSNTVTHNLEPPLLPSPPIALTIAGHDPSSGAGITADLQVFSAYRLFGTSVITALTVQSTLGVEAISPVPAGVFRDALNHLHADLQPVGVKIGMLGSAETALETLKYLQQVHAEAYSKPKIPIIFDPVLKSSSGASLLEAGGIEILRSRLLPAVTWITPNWPELAVLAGRSVSSIADAEAAASLLGKAYPDLYLVVTGGDQDRPVDLLRLPDGQFHHLAGEHIESTSTHGTGCAFSSALLAEIILGKTPISAVQRAKSYVEQAIRSAPLVGHGRGPLNLLWPLLTT